MADKKIAKIVYVGIGAAINAVTAIKEKVESISYITNETSYIHLDTSRSDVVDYAETLIIGGDGSGSQRARYYQEIQKNIKQIQEMFSDKEAVYVFVSAASGGSGIFLPVLLPFLADLNIMVLLIKDTSTADYRENTLKTLQSVLGFAQGERSITMFDIDNVNYDSYEEANKDLSNIMVGLSLVLGDNNALDYSDCMAMFNPDKVLKEKYQKSLLKFELAVNEITPKNVLITRELVLDGDFNGKKEHIDGDVSKQGSTKFPVEYYQDEDGDDAHKIIAALRANQFGKMLKKLTLRVKEDADSDNVELDRVELPTVETTNGAKSYTVL